jgi:hypothetical protein
VSENASDTKPARLRRRAHRRCGGEGTRDPVLSVKEAR